MKKSLRIKFMLPAVLVAFVFLSIIGAINYFKLSTVLVKNSEARISSQAASSAAHLGSWVRRNTSELIRLSRQAHYRNSLKDNFLGQASRESVTEDFESLVELYPFFELVTLRDVDGTPIASDDMEAAIKYADSGKKANVLISNEKYIIYQAMKSPLSGLPVIPIQVGVENGSLKGSLTANINLIFFRSRFMEKEKTVESGHAFLINSQGLVLTHPDEGLDFTLNLTDIGLDKGFSGNEDAIYHNIVREENGKKIIYTAAITKVKGTDLFVAVNAQDREILKGVRIMAKWVIGLGLILMLLIALGIWFFLEFSILKPLKTVRDGLKDVAQGAGDLTQRIKIANQDEVGDLASWFNTFMDAQQDMIKEIMDSAHYLANLTSQISGAASQFAASAAQMVASVTEISTTGEEVKETVRLSSGKAEEVAQTAEATEKVSQGGLSATAKTLDGMERIRAEMEYVAESIVKLSEQTQNIAEIIDAVNELANQSNLLSVNASIEAAKAGDFGKGFAVVAQEVKTLADQSKQATEQVRNILSEIQKATSAAVMATERGSKAVDEGGMLSSEAEEAIRRLSQSSSESAKSSRQIAASSHQQLAGMEQLAHALENIKQVCEQNMDSARQLEQSTGSLKELGESLSNMANRFQV
ncbi:methyl-accepting chemotaxis protein [Desulfatibacillum aliphaticivorans]|uniref:methyl-accepting chemotaxis protein n=1 Tax=Desulfatibacillum aliphaticivorans TaxID=218208 RepID=UPI00040DCF46|nr:methyl-accepting chemotaxis protein [Desulfatibacillum aliphaticivorans]